MAKETKPKQGALRICKVQYPHYGNKLTHSIDVFNSGIWNTAFTGSEEECKYILKVTRGNGNMENIKPWQVFKMLALVAESREGITFDISKHREGLSLLEEYIGDSCDIPSKDCEEMLDIINSYR